MVLYEIFSHSDRFHYRANLFSLATCFLLLTAAFTFLPPFLWTYFAGGFWLKEGRFVEQARVNSSLKYLLWVETSLGNDPSFCSSYSSLNKAFRNSYVPCSATFSYTIDENNIHKDDLTAVFDVLFPSTSTATIVKIHLWLILQYELRARERIVMETLAPATLVAPGTSFSISTNPNVTVLGDLIFEQRKPIQSSGSNTKYNVSIIPENFGNEGTGDLNVVLNEYFKRDFYTTYQTEYTLWKYGSTARSNLLTINAKMNVKQQSIRFIPGFWQEFKWGWIQYLSALLPFVYAFNSIKEFVFRRQLVRTTVQYPRRFHKY